MSDACTAIFREHSRPLEPIPADQQPRLRELSGIRAVLFDLYGTLLISASGEVGTVAREESGPSCQPQPAFESALEAAGISAAKLGGQGVEYLFRAIEASHERSRAAGIEYPEVDIRAVWREVLDGLSGDGLIERPAAAAADVDRLAVEYEARTNPCWPMPGAGECLEQLRRKGILLGIVSNAQFYTPLLLGALLGKSVEELGFAGDLQFFSYDHGRAKPGPRLFELAAEALQLHGVEPSQALCIGNDMLNDVMPAGKLDFHTALFAGDRRSLRRRQSDERIKGLDAELVLTELGQLADFL